MFRTMYDRDKRTNMYNCSGSGVKTEYQLRIDKDKNEYILEPIGKTNLYDYIQSHADSVDITKILEKCAMVNDYSMLNKMPAQFMDVTEMPKTLADAFVQVQDAKNYFDRMPKEIREQYNFNYLDFISDIGSKRFVETVTKFVDSVKAKENNTEVKEVSSDES